MVIKLSVLISEGAALMKSIRVVDLLTARAVPNCVFDLPRVLQHDQYVAELRSSVGRLKGRRNTMHLSSLPGDSQALALKALANLTAAGIVAGPRWCNNKARFVKYSDGNSAVCFDF